MDAWSSIVMVVNILLLIAGWLLFQQAKSDLTARAAETPVLSEVKALQKSIVALLERLTLESGQVSTQLEARCLEARELLAALDRRLEEVQPARPPGRAPRRREPAARERGEAAPNGMESGPVIPASDGRREAVYALADDGLDAAAISQRTGCSVGEVELMLEVRSRA